MIILYLITVAMSQPSPSQCNHYYSSDDTIPQCSNSSCNFTQGLMSLINGTTNDDEFILCLNLPSFSLTVSYTSDQMVFEQISSVYLFAQEIVFEGNYTLLSDNLLVIKAQNASVRGSQLSAKRLWLSANTSIFLTNATIFLQSSLSTNCSCENQKGQCLPWSFRYPYLYENFQFEREGLEGFNYDNVTDNTATFISESIQFDNSSIKYSIIGLIAQEIVISSTNITTTGLGFKSDSGQGCGYFDEVLNQLLGCKGSGGSHGGFGGNSSPQNCYLLISKPPYGSIQYPFEPGSGGGFFLRNNRQASSGGGAINMQTISLTIIKSNIIADGRNGIQGGGGGAGGSISLDYKQISSDSKISASGGNGQKSSSGAGGRIRLWNHKWKDEAATQAQKATWLVHVSGGKNCDGKYSCGENGSVYTSPCRPGFYLESTTYICNKCPLGTYQINFGFSNCVNCNRKPDNAQYIQGVGQYYYESACNYTCVQNYQNRNGRCLSELDQIIDDFGGGNIIISLGIIVGAIIIYLIVVIVRKLSQSQNILSFDQKNTDTYTQSKYFKIQDLPHHQHRLYLSGDNSPFSPWVFHERSREIFNSQMKNPITKVNGYLERIFQKVHVKSQYSRSQKIFFTCLKYTYYALSRVVLTYFRAAKAKDIFQEVSYINKKIPDFESVGIKFHVKKQLTVASLQIFNKTKSVYDFYIENYFPLYFLLEKAPFGGYVIDFADPFLRVFINQMGERQENKNQKIIEEFLKETNRLLKNTKQILPLLNHLWSFSQIIPKIQIYLWQPPNRILGIDKEYSIDKEKQLFLLISSHRFNNKHFIFSQELSSVHFHQIQCLKHKFNLRKESLHAEPTSSFWTFHNSFSERTLLWALGIQTVIALFLSLLSFFAVIFLILDQKQGQFLFGILIFYIIEPLAQFGLAIYSFKTILNKQEDLLANAIFFTLTTFIKFAILFLCILAYTLTVEEEGSLFSIILYVWLLLFLVSLLMLITQLMLRVRIFCDG